MITYAKNSIYYINGEQKKLIEIACLSTDTKPTTDIVTGSIAIEADTGDFYIYNGSAWVKMCTIKE